MSTFQPGEETFEDVEGHKLTHKALADDEGVEGHKLTHKALADDDDVEGHKLFVRGAMADDEDDVEGHRRK